VFVFVYVYDTSLGAKVSFTLLDVFSACLVVYTPTARLHLLLPAPWHVHLSLPVSAVRCLQTCGTPLYIAPEVILQRYGVGADVWSAGILVSTLSAQLLQDSAWSNTTNQPVTRLAMAESVPPSKLCASLWLVVAN
jgi:serine/threonine protein kinase